MAGKDLENFGYFENKKVNKIDNFGMKFMNFPVKMWFYANGHKHGYFPVSKSKYPPCDILHSKYNIKNTNTYKIRALTRHLHLPTLWRKKCT